jgi:hypothetical protein
MEARTGIRADAHARVAVLDGSFATASRYSLSIADADLSR